MKSADPATRMPRVVPFRNAQERRGEELAFLPAALEIVETPPSPIGRKIGLTIILLFCAALVWAWWGTIDIVASATGKIVPSGRTKVIQPFETGVVRSIRVQDGQAVKAGDVLIELDPTVNAAERDHCATTFSRSSSTSRGCARHSAAATIRCLTLRRPPMRTHR
jgi:hemolysin D